MSELIYQKIPAIMAEVGAIAKGQQNAQQRYKYRGIDDVYNQLHDILAKHEVFTVPYVVSSEREERPSTSGGVLAFTTAVIDYHFTATDGSAVTARVIGQGMDSGDKDANKAMAVAHKYALLQVFAIPTDDAKDPEVDSPEPAAPQAPLKAPEATPENAPESVEEAPGEELEQLLQSLHEKGKELLPQLSERAQKIFGTKLEDAWKTKNSDQLTALVQAMTTQVANRAKREQKNGS